MTFNMLITFILLSFMIQILISLNSIHKIMYIYSVSFHESVKLNTDFANSI